MLELWIEAVSDEPTYLDNTMSHLEYESRVDPTEAHCSTLAFLKAKIGHSWGSGSRQTITSKLYDNI